MSRLRVPEFPTQRVGLYSPTLWMERNTQMLVALRADTCLILAM